MRLNSNKSSTNQLKAHTSRDIAELIALMRVSRDMKVIEVSRGFDVCQPDLRLLLIIQIIHLLPADGEKSSRVLYSMGSGIRKKRRLFFLHRIHTSR